MRGLLILALAIGWLPSASAQSNDNFAGRLTLSGASTTAVSNNLVATREPGEPNHAGAGAGRSLWYTWTAPATGTINISTYGTGTGGMAMHAVAIYTGNALGSLTEVASSNDLAQLEYLEGFYHTIDFLAGTSINVPVTAGKDLPDRHRRARGKPVSRRRHHPPGHQCSADDPLRRQCDWHDRCEFFLSTRVQRWSRGLCSERLARGRVTVQAVPPASAGAQFLRLKIVRP